MSHRQYERTFLLIRIYKRIAKLPKHTFSYSRTNFFTRIRKLRNQVFCLAYLREKLSPEPFCSEFEVTNFTQ